MKYSLVLNPLFIKPLIIAGGLMLSLSLTGCGEKMTFMNDCRLSRVNSEVCDCTWKEISKKYSPKLIKKITRHEVYPPQNYGNDLVQALQFCAKQQ